MTIYQQELIRKITQYGCTGQYGEEDKMLQVFYEGRPLCSQGEDGFLRYHEDKIVTEDWKAALENMKEQAAKIREYVRMYETAPGMGIPEVSEYRRMAEYGNIVLAGMYSEQYGFMFTTWQQSADKTSVAHGDYTPNFDYAKESFITRSGLIDRHRLFAEDEAADLYRCIDYTRNNCEWLTYKQGQALDRLVEKLEYGYPKFEDNPPAFEQEDVPGLYM